MPENQEQGAVGLLDEIPTSVKTSKTPESSRFPFFQLAWEVELRHKRARVTLTLGPTFALLILLLASRVPWRELLVVLRHFWP
jgi:hypothetical protein